MHIFAIANIIYALKNTLYVTIFFFFLRTMVKLTDILKFLTRYEDYHILNKRGEIAHTIYIYRMRKSY